MTPGKKVLITGAASGLGKAIALQYANKGAQIIVADIHEARAAQTVDEIKSRGGLGSFVKLDVTSASNWQDAATQVESQWGSLDVLVNNAGVASGGPFDWLSLEDWRWVMDINFYGVLQGCQTFAPGMIEKQSGQIINIASMAGLINPPGMSNYNVSKAAVISLSETLQMELHPYNIGVTCVCPSFFKTNLGETLRSPDQTTQEAMEKLMDNSSNLSADDIAMGILQASEDNQFLYMPHERAALAWKSKCEDLDSHLAQHYPLAEQVKARAKRK